MFAEQLPIATVMVLGFGVATWIASFTLWLVLPVQWAKKALEDKD